MITSYCIIPGGDVYDKNGKVEVENAIYDYGACVYPEGMITSDQMFAFNHEQIEKVCFMGYETEKQKNISKVLIGGLAERERRLAEEAKAAENPTEAAPVIPTEAPAESQEETAE